MKEALNKKIEFYEDRIAERYKEEIRFDFSVPVKRDVPEMVRLDADLNIFLVDYETRKSKRSRTTNDIVKAYFTTAPAAFGLALAEDILKAAKHKNYVELKDYINEIAIVIAYENCKVKVVRAWIDGSSNSPM